MAGLRTDALVSVGAALFVIVGADAIQGHDADPTRVAAQIVSGIGFLGAGVIMKQGSSITGLNTAATLWATAAVFGTVAVVLANLVLRPVARLLDHHPSSAGREEVPAEYTFEVTAADSSEAHVRGLTVQSVSRPEFALRSVRSFDLDDGRIRVVAELLAAERDDSLLESAVSRLSMEPAVSAVRWEVTDGPIESDERQLFSFVGRSDDR